MIMPIVLTASLLFAGCGQDVSNYESGPKLIEYEKDVYRTTLVEKADLKPVLSLTLKSSNYEVETYGSLENSMEVNTINVEVGSKVKPGDVMVEFVAKEEEDYEKQLFDYRKRLNEDKLLKEHYEKISGIDKKNDYTADIAMLDDDIELVNTYISEMELVRDNLRIIAKEEGTVIAISEELTKGVAPAATALFKVASGDGRYEAVTDDKYEFVIDEIYTASIDVATIDMRLVDIQNEGETRRLIFEKANDSVVTDVTDTPVIKIEKPEIKNAVYVDSSAIAEVSGKTYVYVVDEDGFRHAKEITVDSTFDNYAIIGSGLSGGERVVVQ